MMHDDRPLPLRLTMLLRLKRLAARFDKLWRKRARRLTGQDVSLVREPVGSGGATFAYNARHDAVTRVYYLYCARLLLQALGETAPRANVVLGRYEPNFAVPLPLFRIAVQIEHTLVKPGGRDAHGAPRAERPIDGQPYLVRLADLANLVQADAVVDYSAPNRAHVAGSGLYPDLVPKYHVIAPLLYRYEAPNHPGAPARDLGTITLFVNAEQPRRRRFLQALTSQGVAFQNIAGVYDGVEDVYRRTKILLNIRQTDHHDTLEELRVLPALLCGVIVISEVAPLTDACAYADHIVWGRLEEIPALARKVAADYETYRERIFGGGRLAALVARLEEDNRAAAHAIAQSAQAKALWARHPTPRPGAECP